MDIKAKEDFILDMNVVKEEPIPGSSTMQQHKEDTFRCPDCPKEYGKKIALRRHRRIVHKFGVSAEIQCSKCTQTFSANRFLTMHMRVHELNESLTCEICGKTYERRDALVRHRRVHRFNYECKECERKFRDQTSLRLHTVKVHLGLTASDIEGHIDEKLRKKATCEVCGRVCSNSRTLAAHRYMHGPRKHQCSQCPKAFKRGADLRAHTKTVHVAERPFVCQICGDAFKLKAVLKLHLLTHEKDNHQVPCGICGKKIRRDLMRHHNKRMHTNIQFECEKCGVMCKTKKYIAFHIMNVHLGMSGFEITGRRYKCEVCEKEFYYRHSWNKHALVHTTERPFKCSYCPKDYKEERWLREHLLVHEKDHKSSTSGSLAESQPEALPVDPEMIKKEVMDDEAEIESICELESMIKVEEYQIKGEDL